MQHVLVTGFPGFIAENLVARCREVQADLFWHFLVLPNELAPAVQKLRQLGLTTSQSAVYPGDITRPRLGLPVQDVERLQGLVERCFHLAALYDLTAPARVSEAVNVLGTRHVVEFLLQCPHLRKFNYVSTCYVSGTLEGHIAEDSLPEPAGFRNEYERTKHEAEKIVRAYMDRIPTTVFRPAVVVGDSQTGQTDKFDGPYVLILFFREVRHLIYWMPNLGFETTRLNCVPVDFVTTVLGKVGLSDEFIGRTLQIADSDPPTTAESFQALYHQVTGRTAFGVGEGFKRFALRWFHRFPLDLITGIPAQSLDYFQHEGLYRTENLDAACRRFTIDRPRWTDFYRPVVKFALTERRHAPNASVVREFKGWCAAFRWLYALTALAFLLTPEAVVRLVTLLDGPQTAAALTGDHLLWRPLGVSLIVALFVAVTSLARNPFQKPLHIGIIAAKLISTVLFFAYAVRIRAVALVVCGVIDGVIAAFHLLFYNRLKRVREMVGDEAKWDLYHLLFPDRFVAGFAEAMTPLLDEPIDIQVVAGNIRSEVRRLPFTARYAFILCGHYVCFILPCLFGFRPFLLMSSEGRRRFLDRVQYAPWSWSKLPLLFVKLLCTNQVFRQESYLRSIGAP